VRCYRRCRVRSAEVMTDCASEDVVSSQSVHQRITASELTPIAAHMAWVWAVVAVLVLVFGYGFDPVAVIEDLLANRGVNDAQTQAIAIAAGYTLPLVVGTLCAVLLLGWGLLEDHGGQWVVAALCACFAIPAWIGSKLQLGLQPDWAAARGTGPWYVNIPERIFSAYLSSYGFPLMIVGLSIGTGVALQLHRLINHPEETQEFLAG